MNNKLVIIAQRVDEDDDIVGFFISWIKEFAQHFEQVTVITQKSGAYHLPENVRVLSLGKEKNYSKIRQLARLWKFLLQEVRNSRGVFVHMSPIFVVAAWPVVRVFNKKIILWYLHRSVTFRLRLAEKMSYKIVTAAKESLNLKSSKIIETGHGININLFNVSRAWMDSHIPVILSVGRISPIKNFEILIEAARILSEKGLRYKIKIVGRPVMKRDFEYLERLEQQVKRSGLSEAIEFSGFVPYKNVFDLYKKSDIVVNMAPKGGLDKTILEGMAARCIVLTSNAAFQKYLTPYHQELLFQEENPADLAAKISQFYIWDIKKKNEISEFLFQSVEKNHNLARLIDYISKLYI